MCRNKPSELETLQEEPPAYGNGSRTYGFGSRIRMNEWINSAIDDYQITIRTNHTNTSITVDASDIVPESATPIPDADGIPGVDIRLVSQQTGVTAEQALDALRRNTGDIVNSIMELTNSS
jgi:NACalpha-BTF3-like transcription factor